MEEIEIRQTVCDRSIGNDVCSNDYGNSNAYLILCECVESIFDYG